MINILYVLLSFLLEKRLGVNFFLFFYFLDVLEFYIKQAPMKILDKKVFKSK